MDVFGGQFVKYNLLKKVFEKFYNLLNLFQKIFFKPKALEFRASFVL